MKKILVFTLFILSAVGFSQTNAVYNMYQPGHSTVTTQTVTNTTPDTAYISTSYAYETVAIQALSVKVTGTLTATERVEASIDGTNYKAIGDTATLTAATTHSYHWLITGNPYKYYRVIILASTTNSSTFRAYLMPNGRGSATTVYTMKQATGAVSDTVDDSGTGYVSLQVQNSYKAVSIQFVGTKISGTVAGTVTLQGSLNGTNYNTVSTVYLKSNPITPFSTGAVATFTATNGTSTKLWTITNSPYEYYRLSWTGTGTMSGIIKGYLLPNK